MPESAKRGFSLIELLIAISIVAVLASLGLVVYTNIQKDSRDQRRMRDLKTVEQALEAYRSANGSYPPGDGNISTALTVLTGQKYLEDVPTDPLSARFYRYRCLSLECANFALCAQKEGSKFSGLSFCAGVSCGDGNCNMGVSAR